MGEQRYQKIVGRLPCLPREEDQGDLLPQRCYTSQTIKEVIAKKRKSFDREVTPVKRSPQGKKNNNADNRKENKISKDKPTEQTKENNKKEEKMETESSDNNNKV